ncbi:HAMP domain-containing histidine kinase [Candidatus Binatia bacterium]|nr:HAMP domain-containing histidine kinase [Candidatus Binatia bacterium]
MTAAWQPRSLRVRLTASFVLLGGLLVTVAALGASALVARAVWLPLDAALTEEAADLALVLREEIRESRRGATLDHGAHDAVEQIAGERDLGKGKFVVIVDAAGKPLATHGRIPDGVLRTVVAGDPATRAYFLTEGEHAYRVVRHPDEDGTWVVVGVRADRQRHGVLRARWALGAGATALLIVLGAIAWRITSRATAEIDGIAAELEALEAESLHRRVSRRDTSEVDRLAVALNRLLERLDRAVSHLRRFTADAAHELRTPLAALRARLETALASDAGADAQRDGVIDALEQTERLSILAEDLLTLSAVEASDDVVTGEEVDLSSVAREVCDFLEPVAEEQGRALVLTTEPDVTVPGSARLLKRVLVNVLDNAFRHTRAGGGITVDVARAGGMVTVRVSDDGPGFDASDPERVFRRFGHRSTRHSGAGLGLAICQEIVRKHHGRLEVHSSPHGGTTVTFALPARQPAA